MGSPGATGVDGTAGEGLVYLFGQADGSWTESAVLAPSDALPGTNFGQTVSISSDGSVVLVGEASVGSAGEAYVFVEPSGGWSGVVSESAILLGGDSTVHSDFGVSAAITPDGTEAVIGAQYQGGTTSGQGEAYVFTEPPGGWNGIVAPAELLLPNPADVVTNFGGMGNSIAVSGDGSLVAVGNSWAYGGGQDGSGEVYLYSEPGGGWSGSMTPSTTITAPDEMYRGLFGDAISMTADGSTLAITEIGWPSGNAYGKVEIFSNVSGQWIPTDEVTAPDQAIANQFGFSVAIASDGSALLVGAPNVTVGGIGEVGESYYFVNSGGTFQLASQLDPSSPFYGENLGWDVAFVNDNLSALVGAPAFLVETASAPTASALSKMRTGASASLQRQNLRFHHQGLASKAIELASADSEPTAFEFGLAVTTSPPEFVSNSRVDFTEGVKDEFTIGCSGSPPPSLTETGKLPSGVSFVDNGNGTATLSGSPAAGTAGTYLITLVASNAVAPDATQSFTLTVLPIGITTTSLPNGSVYSKTLKNAYSATLSVSGGNPPYRWSLSSGSLPPGLELSSKGVISGKARSVGTYTFTVQVVDTKTKTKPPTQNKETTTLSITIL